MTENSLTMLPSCIAVHLSKGALELYEIIQHEYFHNSMGMDLVELNSKNILEETNHQRNWLNKALQDLELVGVIERIPGNSHLRKVKVFSQYFTNRSRKRK
jgi:hypothetical protein